MTQTKYKIDHSENSNMDKTEVDKFNSLASRWWDPESEFKPLHSMNPIRLDYIDSKAKLGGKAVLDIGCGGGILAESMAQCGAKVTGIDMAEDVLAIARMHLLESGLNIDYRQLTAEQLAKQQPGSFDVITCMELLEHVPDPGSLVKACATLIKPGGHVFFSTINRNSKAYLFAIIGAEYILGMLPKGTHDFAKFIKPSELSSWIRRTGLTTQNFSGIKYHPLTQSFTLSDDVSVNYIIHAYKHYL